MLLPVYCRDLHWADVLCVCAYVYACSSNEWLLKAGYEFHMGKYSFGTCVLRNGKRCALRMHFLIC